MADAIHVIVFVSGYLGLGIYSLYQESLSRSIPRTGKVTHVKARNSAHIRANQALMFMIFWSFINVMSLSI